MRSDITRDGPATSHRRRPFGGRSASVRKQSGKTGTIFDETCAGSWPPVDAKGKIRLRSESNGQILHCREQTGSISYGGATTTQPKRIAGVSKAEYPWDFGRTVRYLIVGLVSFIVVISIGSLPVLYPKIPPPIATSFGVIIAGIVNFFGHRYFTFERNRPILESAARYCVLISFNSLLSGAIVAVLTGMFSTPVILANLASLVVITLSAYLLLQKFVV